jgi:ribokinase
VIVLKKICVIGSFNIDMSVKVPELPKRGETVLLDRFELLIGGGKGANQAIALGRLGADVCMTGLLGDRFFGANYLQVLEQNGVFHDMVEVIENEYPGIAYVAVDNHGDNLLFVYSGANAHVTPAYVEKHWNKIAVAEVFLFQQEIPRETNLYSMKKLAGQGKTIILDPAPAGDFTPELLEYTDIITPNEVELSMISGIGNVGGDVESCKKACYALREMGAKTIVAKIGGNGAYISTGDTFQHIPAFKVKAVDTTAAGDSFNAGLAFGIAAGRTLEESVVLGHAVAGISTTQFGAQSAMPDTQTVRTFLGKHSSSLLTESFP